MFRQFRSLAIVALSVSALAVSTRPALADDASPSLRPAVVDATVAAEPNFLVTGIASHDEMQGGGSGGSGGGFGVGIKGGPIFSSFTSAQEDFKSRTGLQGGIFFGGNRRGTLGVQAEVLYAKKSAETGGLDIDLHYLEVPILLRLNIGSSSLNGVSFYGIGGPVFDVKLKTSVGGVSNSDNFGDFDFGIIGGGGVEITRFLIEARYNWGLRNVVDGDIINAPEIKTRSFAVLFGVRFN